MKSRIAIVCFLLAFLILGFSGCKEGGIVGSTYYFSFKEEQDLENDQGTWSGNREEFSFVLNGINLARDETIRCPFMFSGDLEITLGFWLKATDEINYSCFRVCLTDGAILEDHWKNAWCMDLEGLGCRLPLNENIELFEYGLSDELPAIRHIGTVRGFLGFNPTGYNEWIFRKLGNQYQVQINDHVIIDFLDGYKEFELCDPSWFGLILSNYWPYFVLGGNQFIVFDSVKVVYTGEAVPMPQ